MAESFKEVIQIALESLGADEAAKLATALQGVGDAGEAVNAQLQPLLDQYDALSAKSDSIATALDLTEKVGANAKALADAKASLAALNDEFKRGDKSSADITVAFAQAEKQVKSLAAEQLKLQNASAQANAALKASGVDTANLGAANEALKTQAAGVAEKIRDTATAAAGSAKALKDTADATKEAGKEAKESGGLFQELKDHLGEIISIAAAVELALKGIEFGKESFKEAADLEQSLTRVRALAKGAAEDVSKYEQAVASAGEEAGASALTAAAGMAALVQQGRSADDAIAALVPTLRLAKIAQLDVADAAKIVDGTLSQFGLGVEHSAEVVDLLVVASKGSKDGLTGLADGLGKLAPLARDLNIPLKDTVGNLAFLTQNGLDAGTATKGLASIFNDLRDPASNLRQALFALGDTGKDFNTAITTIAGAGDRGQRALDGLDGSARRVLLFLQQQGPDALNQFRAGLNDVNGEAERTAKLLGENLNSAFTGFSRRISEIGSQLAQPILAPLREEFETLSARLDTFAKSPAFARIQQAIGDLAEQGIEAVDKFISGVDWEKFASGASTAIEDAAKSINSFKDDLSGVATALNVVGTTVGVVYRTIATIFDLAKTAISGAVANKFTELAFLSEQVDRATGSTSKLTIALQSIRDSASDASKNGVAALKENLGKLGDNLKDLGAAGGGTASTFANVSGGAKTVARDVESLSAALHLSIEQLEAIRSIGPPTFEEQAKAASSAATATQRNADALVSAKASVQAASDEMERLARSGDLSSAAFLAAQTQFRNATAELARVRAEIDKNSGAADRLRAAYAALGITSQQDVQQNAAKSAAALDVVYAAFQNGAATIEDVRAAFNKYSEDQLAAVANSDAWKQQTVQDALDVKASVLGVRAAYDDLGKPIPKPDFSDNTKGLQDYNNTVGETTEKTKDLGSTFEQANAVVQASFEETEQHRGSLQAIQIDLSNFSAAAIKAYSDVQDAAFRYGISNDADVERFVKTLNDGNRRISEQIKSGQEQVQTFVDAYSNLSDQQVEDLARQAGGFENLREGIENTVAAAQNGVGDLGLLNDADLSRLEQSASAAAQQVAQIQQRAEQATSALADMASSLRDQIDASNGDNVSIEDRRFQKQLDDLAAQSKLAGDLGQSDYIDAVTLANQLHQKKLADIAEEAAAKKQSDEDAASRKTAASSDSSSSSGGGDTHNVTIPLTAKPPATLNVNGTDITKLTSAQLRQLATSIAGDSGAINTLLSAIVNALKSSARNSGVTL